MKRFTVLGFTEAELGFVLAALFAAVAVISAQSRDSILIAGDRTRAQLDSVNREFRDFRDSVAADAQKRSRKTPGCWEKGEPREAIAEIRVLAANSYEHNGDTIPFGDLEQRLGVYITKARSLGCRYSVIARSTSGVDAPDNTTAMQRLRTHFDVSERAR